MCPRAHTFLLWYAKIISIHTVAVCKMQENQRERKLEPYMKIIDMRCRPPMKSMKEDATFCVEATEPFARMFDRSYMAESAKTQSLPLLMKEMDQLGIEKGVVALRKSTDDSLNQEAQQLLADYPDRFVGFLGLDPSDIPAALKDVEDYIVNGRFTGINLEPSHKGMYIDDERLFPLYEKCEKEQIPVIETFAGALPDSTACMPSHLENVPKHFPELKLCLTHGGWPWFKELAGVLFSYPNIYVSPDGYLMGFPGWRDYVDAANSFCENQVVFGSAYPVHAQEKVLNYFLHCGFREDVLPKVLYDNAAHFLGLDNTDPAPWRSMPKVCPIVNLNRFKF